jgi:hypothetical protein
MPTLTDDYSFMFTNTGVVLNPASTDTTFVDLTRIDGIDSAPFKTSTKGTEGQDGGTVEADFEDIRTITLEGTLYCVGTHDQLWAQLDALKQDYAPGQGNQPLYMKMPGQVQRVIYCKSMGIRYSLESVTRTGQVPIQITLQAGDPTWYTDGEIAQTLNLVADAATGFGFPQGFPLSFGSPTSISTVTVTNGGNKPAGARINIPGPVVNPKILHDTSGAYLEFNITLVSGDYLDIDLLNRTVVLNGSASRYNTKTPSSRWFMLQPGANQIRFLASAVTASVATVYFKSAWR